MILHIIFAVGFQLVLLAVKVAFSFDISSDLNKVGPNHFGDKSQTDYRKDGPVVHPVNAFDSPLRGDSVPLGSSPTKYI